MLPCHFLERLVPGQLLRQSGHALGAALEPPVSGPLSAAGAEDVAIVALVDPLGRVADVRAVDARQLLLEARTEAPTECIEIYSVLFLSLLFNFYIR